VRRATGLGMYEIDWVARRRYWSPELRAILRVPDDLDINTNTDLLERIIPDEMRATFRAKLEASLQAESGGDYDDEHRIVRFDGSTGWILLRGKNLLRRKPTGAAGDALDRPCRRYHRPQAREEANALHASTVLSSNDASSRSIRPDHPHVDPGAERLYGYPRRKRSAAALDPARPGPPAGIR